MKSFKEKNKDLQYLINEVFLLREYNNQKANSGMLHDNALLFAEATVLCVAFERFLRIVPAVNAKKGDTLANLLDHAFSKKHPVFKPIPFPTEDFKKLIRNIRNGILHGLFEDLADSHIKEGKISNKEEYFKHVNM